MLNIIHDPAILKPIIVAATGAIGARPQESLLITGALQNAILNSANFSSIAYITKPIKVVEFMDALDSALELQE